MENTIKAQRLRGFSHIIDIKKLERETWKILFLGFLVGMVFHAGLALVFMFNKTEIKKPDQIEVELFIERQRPVPPPPRLSKPYIVNKKEFFKKELIKRFSARLPSGKIGYKMPASIKELLKIAESYKIEIDEATIQQIYAEIDSSFREDIKIHVEGDKYKFKPGSSGFSDKITRKQENVISLKEELLNLSDLDTGKYKGLVIKDPGDKKNLKGYVYIPSGVWGSSLEPAGSIGNAVTNLMYGFKKYTGVDIKVDKKISIASPEIKKYPFLYITADEVFDLTDQEKVNFGDYLRNGGFAFMEGYNPPNVVIYPQKGLMPLIKMVKDSLDRNTLFSPIMMDNPVYHCFFDFDKPIGFTHPADREDLLDFGPNIMGVWLNDRLVAVISDKEYGASWTVENFETPYFRAGVNFVVYSLIREDSSAKKYIRER